jgi:hypothetical protein
MNANQTSTGNTLPAPYCALSRMAYPSELFKNLPTNIVSVSLSGNGQTFDISNDGNGVLGPADGAFYIIGY